MLLKNRVFKARTRSENRRKLDIALRRLTGDRLTKLQRRLIGDALGHRRQYTLCLTDTPYIVSDANGWTSARTIFGSPGGLPQGPAAVLVRRSGANETNIVYIFLPHEEENKNGS